MKFGGAEPTESGTFADKVTANRSKEFGNEVKKRILLGAFVLSQDAYQSHYLQAQKVRRMVQIDFDSVFHQSSVLASNSSLSDEGVDLIITPVSIGAPPKLDDLAAMDPLDEYLNDIFTVPASLAGLPAITLPICETRPLPVQVIGQYGQDQFLLHAIKHIT
jgi:aspartyl-tRNA(Asn)/glutamyl-tRNA(Gln) amidotransferase subunit A